MKTRRPSHYGIKTLRQVKKAAIVEAIRQLDGNITLAAQKLGITLSTLQHMLKEYRVSTDALGKNKLRTD